MEEVIDYERLILENKELQEEVNDYLKMNIKQTEDNIVNIRKVIERNEIINSLVYKNRVLRLVIIIELFTLIILAVTLFDK